MTLTKRTELRAILGEEFYALMDDLGVREAFDSGKCTCEYCNEVVDTTNVLLVFPKSGHKVAFLCTNPTCASRYDPTLGLLEPRLGFHE